MHNSEKSTGISKLCLDFMWKLVNWTPQKCDDCKQDILIKDFHNITQLMIHTTKALTFLAFTDTVSDQGVLT